jgi:hypothetical protein
LALTSGDVSQPHDVMELVERSQRSEIEELNEVADRLAARDPYSYSDPESIRGLQRVRNKIDSITAHAVVNFEHSGEWAPDGARSAVGWMAKECRLPTSEGKAQLRRGKMLEESPVVAAAFAAGDIGVDQVDHLVRARRSDPSIFERDQEMLVDFATTLKFGRFVVAVEQWKQFADPDGAEEAEFARAERRDVWVVPTPSGMYMGKMNLDPLTGATFSKEHERLGQILFEADWAEAKERLGRDPKVSELRRTPAQRRADALFQMSIRSASMPADAQRPEPLITILVGYETALRRICQIEGGPVVSPGSVVHLMDGAEFERIVFKPGNRIECSQKARFFTGGTRRAIEVRDPECGSPYCETPAKRCQIDHIIPYSKGGLTTLDNGQVLCGPCNRMRNVAEPPWMQLTPPGGWSHAAERWPDPFVAPDPPSPCLGPEPEPGPEPGPEPPGG